MPKQVRETLSVILRRMTFFGLPIAATPLESMDELPELIDFDRCKKLAGKLRAEPPASREVIGLNLVHVSPTVSKGNLCKKKEFQKLIEERAFERFTEEQVRESTHMSTQCDSLDLLLASKTADFKRSFRIVDKGGEKKISADQVVRAMKSLGQNPTKKEVEKWIAEVGLIHRTGSKQPVHDHSSL